MSGRLRDEDDVRSLEVKVASCLGGYFLVSVDCLAEVPSLLTFNQLDGPLVVAQLVEGTQNHFESSMELILQLCVV